MSEHENAAEASAEAHADAVASAAPDDEGAAFAASDAEADAAADDLVADADAYDAAFAPEDEEDEGPGADDVVAALISALVSGNAAASENALILAAEAGYDVSGGGFIPQPKRDLVALEQAAIDAQAEPEAEDAAEEADES